MPSTSPAPISKGSEDAARRVDAGEPPPADTAPTTEANDHAPTIEIGRQSQLLDASLQDPGVGQYVGPGTGTMTRLALAAGFVGGGACSLVAATAIWVWRNRRGARRSVIRLDGARPLALLDHRRPRRVAPQSRLTADPSRKRTPRCVGLVDSVTGRLR